MAQENGKQSFSKSLVSPLLKTEISFLWKQVQGQCVKYAWTGKNDYVTLCQNTFIAFGGG